MEMLANFRWRAENVTVICTFSGIGPREDLEKVIGNGGSGGMCQLLVLVLQTVNWWYCLLVVSTSTISASQPVTPLSPLSTPVDTTSL